MLKACSSPMTISSSPSLVTSSSSSLTGESHITLTHTLQSVSHSAPEKIKRKARWKVGLRYAQNQDDIKAPKKMQPSCVHRIHDFQQIHPTAYEA